MHVNRSLLSFFTTHLIRELHLRWHSRALSLAFQILGDRDEAEEATQDAFIDAWRRLPDYDETRGTEWAWLRMMTQSRCFDRLRAARRHEQLARRSCEEAPLEEGTTMPTITAG